MFSHPTVRLVARFVAEAGAYWLATLLGTAFVVQPEKLSIFWPAGGLMLGYLLAVDRRHWPRVVAAAFAGNVVGNLTFGHSPLVSAAFAVVNAAEPVAVAWLIGYCHGPTFRLERTKEVFWLLGCPLVVCAGTALAGAGLVTAWLGAPSYWGVWKVWWLADALGAFLFAPLVLAWSVPGHRRPWRWHRTVEFAALFALLTAAVWGVFVSDLPDRLPILKLPFPLFLPLLWVALRANLRGTAAALVVTCLVATWGTLHDRGPLASLALSDADQVLMTQAFVVTVCLASLVLLTTLRERRAAEAEVHGQRAVLRTILDNMGEAVLVVDAGGKVLLRNAAFERLHADVPTEPYPPTAEVATVFGLYLPDGETLCPPDRLPLDRALGGEASDNVQLVIRNPANPAGVHISVAGRPIVGPAGIEGGVITIRDVTAAVKAEEALRRSEERYRLVVEALAEGVVLQTADGSIVAANDRACQILGLTRDQLTGRSSLDPRWQAIHDDGSPFPGGDHPAMVAVRTGKPVFNVVMGVRKPTGELTWMTINAVPIPRAGGADSGAVVASFHDVTAARQLDQQVRASLREKEVLLKEIHHRVKNNLQIISTLLDLQSDYTAEPAVLEMFQESRGRVKSMALIHERLYRSQDLAGIDVREYVLQLADDLAQAYQVTDADVTLDLDVSIPSLPIDVAIPCGLLLNELMSNCFKHAFKEAETGRVGVSLRRAADGRAELAVADDGRGLPPGLDYRNTASFGLQLVHTLADQLAGEVEFASAGGTTVTVRFPNPRG